MFFYVVWIFRVELILEYIIMGLFVEKYVEVMGWIDMVKLFNDYLMSLNRLNDWFNVM